MPRFERPTFRRALVAGAACLLATLSCGRDVTGPQALRLMRGFSFDARFDAPGLANGVAGEIVQFDRVRVVLVNTLGDTVVDRVVDFPSTAEEVELALDVPITTGAPPSGETMALALRYINAQDDTVFRGGPLPVDVVPTLPGQTPPPPPVIPVTYTGVGADAVSIVVTPQLDTVLAGDAFAFTAVALDGQGQPIASTPVAWRSESPTRATITAPGAGAGTSLPSRGPAMIIAQLLTGPADTVTLEVLPRAQALTIVSGNNQAAAFNATLPQPLVTRVVATDGQPMAGVTVSFVVTSGGGSVSAPSAVTDANGLAQVTWTTGAGLGAQLVSATVAGLAGGTVNFTALAPTTELLHAYPMSAGLVDVAGGQDGALVGGASVVNDRLTLDGTSGYAQLPAHLVPTTGSYSVSFFVRVRTPAGTAATYLSQGTAGDAFFVGPDATGILRVGDDWPSTGVAAPAADGLFRHIVVTVDSVANASRLYVNGTLQATLPQAIASSALGTGTRLGRQHSTGLEYLDGDIDELSIHRGALSAAQVAAMSAAGITGPGRLVFGVQPSNAVVGSAITPALTVRAEDALGRLRTDFDQTIVLAFASNPGGQPLAGLPAANAVAGVATFPNVVVNATGTGYTLTATAAGFETSVSTPFDVTAGAATALAFVQQPTTVPAGSTIAPPVTVEVVDALGNRVTGYDGNVTVALGTNPGGATLGGTTTGIVVDGVATFSTLSVSAAGAGYTLVASAPGLTDATSAGFTVGASLAVNAWTNAAGGSWSVGTNWSLGRAPLPADSVVIALDGTYTVTLDAAATVGVMTVGGGTGTKTFDVVNQTLTVNTSLRTLVGGVLVTGNGIITGAGAVENGGQFTSNGGTVQSPLINAGLLLVRGGLNVTGALTTVPGSTIRVQANGGFGPVGMNVSAGFTNHGLIDLTAEAAYDAALAVQSGVFVNAADGTLVGSSAAGGNRYFSGALDNQGTITISSFFPMTLAGTANVNAGTINVNGTLNLGMPGGAVLTNDGSVVIGAGQTLALTDGTWQQSASGTMTGGLVSVVPGATLRLLGGTIASSVANSGTVEATDASGVTGTFSMNTGSLLRVAPLGASGVAAVLTVANGFTNSGTIELTNLLDAPRAEEAQLVITAGTITNAAAGVIRALPGNGGGDRGIMGNVANAGLVDVAPGSAALLAITGNLASTGTIAVDVGGATPGTLHDQVAVSGTATLGGTLNAGLFGGYVPPVGSSFTLVTAGTVTGTFATVNAASPLLPTPTYSSTGVTLTGPVALLANSWTNASGGNWSVGTNWSLGRAPIASDTVLIALPGDYTVSMDVNDTVSFLIVGGGTGTQTLSLGVRTLRVDSLLSIGPSGAVTITGTAGNLTGPGIVSNQGTVATTDGTISADLVNQGALTLRGITTISGTLTNAAGATMTALASAVAGSAQLTVTDGFINDGLIELTTADAAYGNVFIVTNGALVNTVNGVIRSTAGQGGKSLNAQLDNQGLIDLQNGLTIARASSAHLNSGTINVAAANLTVTQTGTTPSFTNAGTITLSSGRTMSVTGGTLDLTGGTLDGPAATLSTNATTVNMDIASARTRFTLVNSTVPGTFTIPAGDSLRLAGGSPNMTIANAGRLVLQDVMTFAGGVTTGDTTSVIEIRSAAAYGQGNITFTNGFTNTGLIELRTLDAAYGNRFAVTNGTLVNAPGGIIRAVPGQGSKELAAQLDNQGLLDVREALVLNRASSAHLNSGVVDLATANLTVTQTGTAPSFTNTGTINLPAGRTLSVTGGTLTLTGGTFNGPAATLSTNATTVNTDIVSARTRLTLTNSTVPGTFIIPAGDSLRLVGGSPSMTITNAGRLVLQDVMTFPGTVTTGDTTSVIEIRSSAAYGQGNITFTNGFTNTGLIELCTLDAAYGNRFAVTNGTLVNAPGGIIRAVPGQGSKELAAQLDNQGLLDVREALVLNRASSAHLNSGVVDLATANLTVTQTGTTPSFTNSGTINAPAGRTFSVTGGTLTLTGGTFNGPAATLNTNATTVNMDIASARTRFTLTNSTVPGTFTIPALDSLRLVGGSPNMTIANSGRLVLQDVMTFPGTVTTGDTTSVIEIRSAAAYGQGNITFTNGFTNTGLIELRTLDAAYGNRFAVTNGTLVNAPGGIIRAVPGQGSKELAVQLDNQGLLDVREALTLNRASSAHLNSGVIDLATANLSVSQTGTTPSFTNTGTINLPTGRTLSVTGGTLDLTGGTLDGPAATLVATNATVQMDIASARTRFNLTNSTVPGTFTIPALDSLRLVGGSPNMTIANSGRLVLQDVMTFPGTVTTGDTTSVIEIRSSAAYGQANIAFTNGFTNTGLIELRTLDAAYGNRLGVTNGTLVNAPGGIIRAVAGNGSKELAAQLDNQGLFELREAVNLNRGSSVHLNSGVIDLALGNLSVSQTGTTPSFTSTGTINAPAGRTMFVTGGTLNLTGGTFNGPAATLNAGSATVNFDLASVETRLQLNNSTVPGTLTIPAGDTLRLVGGTPTMTIVNDGTLLMQDIVTVNGTLTSNAGSVVEALSSAEFGQANVTFANAFTNNGTFRLRTADAAYGQAFTFSSGTFVNGAGGTISFEGIGGRTLTAPAFTNDGIWNVASTSTVNGPIAQNGGLTVQTGSVLTLSSLLTLNDGSTTTVNGTLTKNGGCTLNGTATIGGTGTGITCP